MPIAKKALSPMQIQLRLDYALEELRQGFDAAWYFRNCIYMDPNYTILTINPRSTFDIKQASKGTRKRRWISPDKKYSSRNLPSSRFAGKQKSKGDRKVWWHTILARGLIHFEYSGSSWARTAVGQAEAVAKLEAVLKGKMLGEDVALPRVVVTDRGPGFCSPSGYFCNQYRDALHRHGSRPYVGADATKQPGDLADCWPHERVMSWVNIHDGGGREVSRQRTSRYFERTVSR